MSSVKINSLGIYNIEGAGSYRHYFESGFNIVLGNNRVGKTTLAQLPFYTLGCSTQLEDISEVYKDFLTFVELEIDKTIYYFFRLKSKNYNHNLFILNKEFKIIWKGKSGSKKGENIQNYSQKILELFDLGDLKIKNDYKDKTVFESPYTGILFEFFYISQSFWGKDWKVFNSDLKKIDKKSIPFIHGFLSEKFYKNDLEEWIKYFTSDFDVKSKNEYLVKLNFLINKLSEKIISDQDIKQNLEINNKAIKILKNKSELEQKLMDLSKEQKEIEIKINQLKKQLGYNNKNISNLSYLEKEYGDFYSKVTLEENKVHKIYFKDLMEFKVKKELNKINKETVLEKIKLKNKEINNINKEIMMLKNKIKDADITINELGLLSNELIEKDYDLKIKQIIEKSRIEFKNIKNEVSNINMEKREAKKLVDSLIKKFEDYDKNLSDQLKNIINSLKLKYDININCFIVNSKVHSGAAATIYSLSKLYLNFINFSKLNSFYVIDSPREKEQDEDTITARNELLNKFLISNLNEKKQVILFTVKDDFNLDKNKISISRIERQPQSLLTDENYEFRKWIENNVLEILLEKNI
ncbi:hypothetical protein SHELI_v1c04450 [Spiroplasma helicoides]|uniref:Uncharacterized protein n=1 Tax=Spiroplasma helicoides TaxID=216938 RepID=A0A1B3SKE8_9MOLU|nr:hypothetical protein [Spiroplasma helicoides]AOG60396.1 hypothetical protein SHELI_v1c04450 [Spiroplasma helicoides]